MIYDINGNLITTPYGLDGVALSQAYDINGSIVHSTGELRPDYNKYSYTQVWATKGKSPAQGFDILNDKVYWALKSGNTTPDTALYIFNLDGTSAVSGESVTVYGGHANNVTFSHQYTDEDNLPLVLMSTAYDNPVYLNRIDNDNNAAIIRKYTIPMIDGIVNKGFDMCYGDTDDTAYTASVFGSNGDASLGTHICIAKWDMANLTVNDDGTYTPSFVSSAETAWHYWKQGIKYHDGLIWLASGYPNYNAYVYGIDPASGETIATINCNTTTEIEGAVWYPDASAIGGYALYVGFQGMSLRKYVFDAKM